MVRFFSYQKTRVHRAVHETRELEYPHDSTGIW